MGRGKDEKKKKMEKKRKKKKKKDLHLDQVAWKRN
jgi:hypothetical protein